MDYNDYPSFRLAITNVSNAEWTPLDIIMNFAYRVIHTETTTMIQTKQTIKQIIMKETSPLILLLSILESYENSPNLEITLIGWHKFFTRDLGTPISHSQTIKQQLKTGRIFLRIKHDPSIFKYNLFVAPNKVSYFKSIFDKNITTTDDDMKLTLQLSCLPLICTHCSRVHDNYLPHCFV